MLTLLYILRPIERDSKSVVNSNQVEADIEDVLASQIKSEIEFRSTVSRNTLNDHNSNSININISNHYITENPLRNSNLQNIPYFTRTVTGVSIQDKSRLESIESNATRFTGPGIALKPPSITNTDVRDSSVPNRYEDPTYMSQESVDYVVDTRRTSYA